MTIVRSLSNIFLAWLIKRAEVMSGTYSLDVFYQIHLLLDVFQFGKVCQMNTLFKTRNNWKLFCNALLSLFSSFISMPLTISVYSISALFTLLVSTTTITWWALNQ